MFRSQSHNTQPHAHCSRIDAASLVSHCDALAADGLEAGSERYEYVTVRVYARIRTMNERMLFVHESDLCNWCDLGLIECCDKLKRVYDIDMKSKSWIWLFTMQTHVHEWMNGWMGMGKSVADPAQVGPSPKLIPISQ